MTTLKTRAVASTHTSRVPAFIERLDGSGGLEEIELPHYPPSPQGTALRVERTARGMTMGEAARLAGLTVAQWSALELGGLVAENWAEAFAIVRGEK